MESNICFERQLGQVLEQTVSSISKKDIIMLLLIITKSAFSVWHTARMSNWLQPVTTPVGVYSGFLYEHIKLTILVLLPTWTQCCWIIGQQTIAERNVECIFLCWIHAMKNRRMMYVCTLKNIYSGRCSHIAVHGWSEYALEML